MAIVLMILAGFVMIGVGVWALGQVDKKLAQFFNEEQMRWF